MGEPRIGVVIVTWNKKDHVLLLLKSLDGLEYDNHEIFVVDNASDDNTIECIEHEFKQAKLELQEDILEKALVKAQEIINTKITTADQDKLIDEYLEKVVAS